MSATVTAADATHRYLRESPRHAEVSLLRERAIRHRVAHAGGDTVWHEWGAGPSVVLLHGGFGSWLHWVRNIGPLAEHFRVLAADLPGLGESDPVPQESPSAQAVAAPLIDGIERLLPPGEPLRMACFSLGSVIGAQVAAALTARLGRLVLLGPSGLGDLWRNLAEELARRHPSMSDSERRAAIRQNLQRSMIARDEAIDEMALDIQLDLVRQGRRLRGLPISLSDALTSVLPRLSARATLVWGEADPYPVPDVAGAITVLRERIPGLDARIVPGAGHWVAYEAAEAINRLLLASFQVRAPAEARARVAPAGGNDGGHE